MQPAAACRGLFISFCLLFLLLNSCSAGKMKAFRQTRVCLYTIVTITVYSDSEQKAKAAVDATYSELDRLGGIFNFYSEGSEVSAVNRSSGISPVKVSKDTVDVIERALYVSRCTEGAFDITVGPIVKMWDFEKKILPDRKIVNDSLDLVNYRNVVVDKAHSTVFLKKKGMQIDLGGIEKGYAADRAVEILKKNGISAGIVAVGGEVKPFGSKPGGGAWIVGIKNPDQKSKDDELAAIVKLNGRAISTSGGYEKFFVKDGQQYHHILDPATGFPAYKCKSVSVIGDNAPDGFPTGIFVLGPEKGMEVLKKYGLDGIIVENDGEILATDGIRDKLEILRPGQAGK